MSIRVWHCIVRRRARAGTVARRVAGATLLAALLALGAGCGTEGLPTGVDPGTLSGAVAEVTRPEEVVTEPVVVARVGVDPASDAILVGGGRLELTIPPGAVPEPVVVTLAEVPPEEVVGGGVELAIQPDGLLLLEPAMLRISYAGTALDPADPRYKGGEPELWWLDDNGRAVEQLEGLDDPVQLMFSAPIESFGQLRLLVAVDHGTAGWD
ncbi:MAG: hypothetical protein PVF43_10395 [Candidatus Eiseniibacteriota bacterium]|jgi:hypothetical protein